MGKKSGPKPPDPVKTIEAETKANRLNTFQPGGGGQEYGFVGNNGQFVSNKGGVTPKGKQAAVRIKESDAERQLRETLSPTVNTAAQSVLRSVTGLPNAPKAPTAADFRNKPAAGVPDQAALPEFTGFNREILDETGAPKGFGYHQPIADALFERSASMMRPEIDRQGERLLGNLQARGMPVGSEGFNDAYGNYTREVGDTYSRLAMDGVLAAGQEDSRRFAQEGAARDRAFAEQSALYGMDADTRNRAMMEQDRLFNYQNTVRDRAIGEAGDFYNMGRSQRDAAFGELSSFLGGQYTPTSTYARQPSVPGIDAAGAINAQYQGQLANAQNRQAAYGGLFSGLTSLGGAAILASSKTWKADLGIADGADMAEKLVDLEIHEWSYLHPENGVGLHIGPFAEDFYDAFGAGVEKAIFATDPAGVALAVVKHLIGEIANLKVEVERLKEAA